MSPDSQSLIPMMADKNLMIVDPRNSTRSVQIFALVAALALLVFTGCSGSGGGVADATPGGTVQPELNLVEYGRLVDVYGLQVTPEGSAITLFRDDVMVGGDIQDQRPTESNLTDAEILYDFIAADPDTLQPRLFIPRDVTSSEFQDAFDALDDQLERLEYRLLASRRVLAMASSLESSCRFDRDALADQLSRLPPDPALIQQLVEDPAAQGVWLTLNAVDPNLDRPLERRLLLTPAGLGLCEEVEP